MTELRDLQIINEEEIILKPGKYKCKIIATHRKNFKNMSFGLDKEANIG